MKCFFHGTNENYAPGNILTGRDAGARMISGIHASLIPHIDAARPEYCLEISKSVIMTAQTMYDPKNDALDDLEQYGEAFAYAALVLPLGRTQAHDANWLSDAQSFFDEGDIRAAREAIHYYWIGVPSREPSWEYVTQKAEVLDIVNFLTHEFVLPQSGQPFIISPAQLTGVMQTSIVDELRHRRYHERDRLVVTTRPTRNKDIIQTAIIFNQTKGMMSEFGVFDNPEARNNSLDTMQKYMQALEDNG